MKFAFDIDRCLCDGNIAVLRLMDMLSEEQRKNVEKWYYMERKPLLNPEEFLTDDDEYIIITGRSLKFEEITKKWVQKFCPNHRGLFMANLSPAYGKSNEYFKTWDKKQAALKADIINREKADVYFEDNREVVKHLRKLCPNTKIIHYGGGLY